MTDLDWIMLVGLFLGNVAAGSLALGAMFRAGHYRRLARAHCEASRHNLADCRRYTYEAREAADRAERAAGPDVIRMPPRGSDPLAGLWPTLARFDQDATPDRG